MLHLESVEGGYDQSRVLFGVSLDVRDGEVVALMGRNGMGKTTTVNCITGLVRVSAGSLTFDGRELSALPPYRIARLGIALVPEGRQVFPTLTIYENLIATAANYGRLPDPWTVERVYELFPQLRERSVQLAGTLSGGEQQMLAIGRALMLSPKLLILDEATEGLAPLIRDEIWSCLAALKRLGQSILLIDKNLEELAPLCDRGYVMEKGHIVWQGAMAELMADENLQAAYLGL
ncbi:MAG: ABC transporter ATP-binding protein [Pseudorhodoplanes sp.]|uniref:ABC transporter ATP-binding protein n=1 Tax=Pseudorhodoplanes sp. TaxID=1934341 RepID=UPI003D13D1A4